MRKSYAVEERMSGDWIERWRGFSSLKHARAVALKMDSQCHGALRIVRVIRQPTDMDARAFTFGIMAGLVITIGSLALVSWSAGIKWQPVKIERHPTADEKFGCTPAQTTPSGECR